MWSDPFHSGNFTVGVKSLKEESITERTFLKERTFTMGAKTAEYVFDAARSSNKASLPVI